MAKKYLMIFSIAILLASSSVLAVAANKNEWTSGDFHYVKTAKGVIVTQIKVPTQATLSAVSFHDCSQQCMGNCKGSQPVAQVAINSNGSNQATGSVAKNSSADLSSSVIQYPLFKLTLGKIIALVFSPFKFIVNK